MAKSVYIHDEDTHNLSSPNEIVPELMRIFNPASVIDIGCGIGTFLHVFKKAGVKDVLGVDGPWANKALLSQFLDKEEFVEHNLDSTLTLSRRFDMAICLEVGEHLSDSKSAVLVSNLVQLSDVIIFSAAIPGQDGQNHINEQWPAYWMEKFESYGYVFCDFLRNKFWNNSNIQWWYSQNMFVAISKNTVHRYSECAANTDINFYIHPSNYIKKLEKIKLLESGKAPFSSYVKFLLRKAHLMK